MVFQRQADLELFARSAFWTSARGAGRRFVVHLNGHRPSELMELLEAAGIGRERVHRAAMGWEDILKAAQVKETRE